MTPNKQDRSSSIETNHVMEKKNEKPIKTTDSAKQVAKKFCCFCDTGDCSIDRYDPQC